MDDRRAGMMAGRVLTVAVLCAIVLPASVVGQACDTFGPRKECGYNGIPEQFCKDKGCCYNEAPTYNGASPMELPACFRPNAEFTAYRVVGNITAKSPTSGLIGELVMVNSTLPELGPDIEKLQLQVGALSNSTVRIRIGAPGRWEIPRVLHPHSAPDAASSKGQADYAFYFSGNGSNFDFGVTRKEDRNEVLFSTLGHRLIFKDQYIEISSTIPNDSTIYGLGETTNSNGIQLRRTGWPFVMWNRDSPASLFDQNVYGSHPFYMEVRADGQAHGVMMLNSNGMEVAITPERVQWRLTGGIIDMYVMAGPTPAAVLDQFTSIIGRPVMPPYWSLGLMQSKYGYGSVEYIDQVVTNYTKFNIPLETFVTDSQYMDKDKDFTLSNTYALADFQAFVSRLHRQGQRWVPILDPGIHIQEGYKAWEQGRNMDVWIKDISGNPYVGQLWPGVVNFPDFMSPAGQDWWAQQITSFHENLPMDGLWLDMNEISNYCTGDVCIDPGGIKPRNDFICELKCENGPDAFRELYPNGARMNNSGLYDPPFRINNANGQRPLSEKTIPVTAVHYNGALEYNVHNLYSLYEVVVTANVLRNITGKRQFILTRSSFLGSGAYAAHWTGDTASDWLDMQYSISSILTNGLAGIAFAGADICGFMNYPDETLCGRWTAIGAWYPYSRNHHAQGFQEFYRWESVAEAARQNFGWRYRALPYLYSAFFTSHVYGCPVARPLFFSFPADKEARNSSYQWMMGDGLLISPILNNGTDDVSAYFPEGEWYSLYTKALFQNGPGNWRKVTAKLTDPLPIHVLGGIVVPLGPEGVNLTSRARTGPLTLLAALPQSRPGVRSRLTCSPQLCKGAALDAQSRGAFVACGQMYLDDGESLALSVARDNAVHFGAWLEGDVASGVVTGHVTVEAAFVEGGCANQAWPPIVEIVIMGVPGPAPAQPATRQVEAQSLGRPDESSPAGRRLQQAASSDNAPVRTAPFGPAALNAAASSLNGQGTSSSPPPNGQRGSSSSGGSSRSSPPPPPPPPPNSGSSGGNSGGASGNQSPGSQSGGSSPSPSPPPAGENSESRSTGSPPPPGAVQTYLADAYKPPPTPSNTSSGVVMAMEGSSGPAALETAREVPYVAQGGPGPAGAPPRQPPRQGAVSLPADAVVFDPVARTLTLSNLNLVYTCAQNLAITFTARLD